MVCEKCGVDIEKNEKFCPECGTKQNKISKNAKRVTQKIKSSSIKSKTIFVILFVVVLAVVALFVNNNPNKIVGKFCDILVDGNSIDIFDIMYFPESDYITKDKIEDAKSKMFEKDEYLGKIDECEYKKISSYKDKIKYKVTLKLDGKEEDEEIQVIKKNKFLLFNDYKLYMEEFLYGDESITVYKNSKVYVDEKELKNPEATESNQETYTLKNVLSGADYKIKITHPLFETYEGTNFNDYYISDYENIVDELKPSIKKEIEDTITNFVKEIYPSAYEKKPTSGAEGYIAKDKININDIIDDINAYNYYTYKEVNVSNINFDSINYADYNKLKVDMRLRVNYSYETGYNSYSYSSYSTEYPTITIEKTNDSWKITGFEE